MTSMVSSGALMADGTRCRTGPSCQRHGVSVGGKHQGVESKEEFFQSLRRPSEALKPAEVVQARPTRFKPAQEPRVGLNGKSSVEELEKFYAEGEEWRKNLSDYEEAVIDYYMLTSTHLNSFLWGGSDHPSYYNPKHELPLLDSALGKVRKPDTPRTLFRYLPVPDGHDAVSYAQQVYKVGETVNFPSYVSTTTDSDLMVYKKRSKPQEYVVFEIISKEGAVLQRRPGRGVQGVQESEREVLLPRGMDFTVANVIEKVPFKSSREEATSSAHEGTESFTVIQLVDSSLE